MILQLAAGEIEPALGLAEKLVVADNANPHARLALAASAIRDGKYELAKNELKGTPDSPLAALTAGILGAWADLGLGKTDEALASIDALTGPAWYGLFKNYHSALIADVAGRRESADAAIDGAYNGDGTSLRLTEAYARIKARNGNRDEALRVLQEFNGGSTQHPVIKSLIAELEADKEPAPVVATAQAGAAELLYGLGTAIGSEESTTLAAAHLQLAHFLDPSIGVINLALGDIFQRADQCEKAVEVYGKVQEDSPLKRNAAIQTGLCLNNLGRTDEGANHIKRVVDADPSDVEAAIALGNLYRGHERFAEAGEAYTVGITAMDDATDPDWRIYYFRGVSFERTKRWPEAETDFKRALDINPNQPQVLNYLGYSWVDMGLNLDVALGMIRTAVELRPNDGYIVDSLGWAHYKLEQFEEAVEQLERAVELQPEDPVINDHLGDAYWQVGRKREAKFQWAHARDLEPEESELPKILAKIENGLNAAVEVPEESKEAAKAPSQTQISAVNPVEEVQPTSSVTVEVGDTLSTIAERVYGDASLFLQIFDANRDRLEDPNVIRPGMTLKIPTPDLN